MTKTDVMNSLLAAIDKHTKDGNLGLAMYAAQAYKCLADSPAFTFPPSTNTTGTAVMPGGFATVFGGVNP